MNDSLKLKNQATIEKFSENLKDLTPVAEFMPKDPHGVILYIRYWEEKLQGSPTKFMKNQAKDQIRKLERLMVAGTELAIDFLGNVEATILPAEEIESKRKVGTLTLDETRIRIAEIYNQEGEEIAYTKGKLLLGEDFKDGSIMLPNAVNNVIKMVIDEIQKSKQPIPLEISKKGKDETFEYADGTKHKPDNRHAYEELKKRYPDLSENITDEECMLIDVYDKVLLTKEDQEKTEELRFESAKTESERILKSAREKLDKKSSNKKEAIFKNVEKKYNELPSEDRLNMTLEEYVIYQYAMSIPEGVALKDGLHLKRHPILDFCTPETTLENERIAMKRIQDTVIELLADNKEKDARTLARLFFGNFGGESLISFEKGRAWSDGKVNEWFKWIKNGSSENEWHLYELKKHNESTKSLKVITSDKEELKTEYIKLPEHLEVDLAEVMEGLLAEGEQLKDHVNEIKELYKTHKREYNSKEVRKFYARVKSNFILPEPEKIQAETEIIGENQTLFHRVPLKDVNPELWEKTKNIKSLEALHTIMKKENWQDALNLAHDLIIADQIPEAKGWTTSQVDDWFNKFIDTNDLKENLKETAQITINQIEFEKDLIKLETIDKRRPLRKAVAYLLKQYGTDKIINYAIAHKMQTLKKGYLSNFTNKPITEIYKFILGVRRLFKINLPELQVT